MRKFGRPVGLAVVLFLTASAVAYGIAHQPSPARLTVTGSEPANRAFSDSTTTVAGTPTTEWVDPCSPPPPDPKLAKRLETEPDFAALYTKYWAGIRADGGDLCLAPDAQNAKSNADVQQVTDNPQGLQDLANHPPPTVAPIVSTAEGINNDTEKPPGLSNVRLSNSWYGFEAPATVLEVYAGAQTEDDGTLRGGVIYVWRKVAEGYLDSSADRPGSTLIPLQTSSSVSIQRADGHVLILVGDDGTTFRFDVDAMKVE
jgi:hypothetical protein